MTIKSVRLLVRIAAVVLLFAAAVFATAAWLVTPDRIRATLEGQASRVLAEPVAIERVSVAWYPRIALRMRDVRVGAPPRIHAVQIDVSTGLRGLVSRRVEEGELTIRNSRVDLPVLLELIERLGAAAPASTTPVVSESFTIDSVRAIALDDVTLVAGSHALVAHVTGTLAPNRLNLTSFRGESPGTSLTASGVVTWPPMNVVLRAHAERLNVNELIAFITRALPSSDESEPPAEPGAATTPLVVDVTADRGTLAGVAFTDLATRIVMTSPGLTFDPLRTNLFGGRIDGRLTRTSGAVPRLQITGSVAGADASRVLAWLGQAADSVSGRLSADVQLGAEGDVTAAAPWHGTARVVLSDGTLKGLSAVRNTIVRYAGRSATGAASSGSDRFERINGVFTLDGSVIRCRDVVLTSPDMSLRAEGTISLPGGALALRAQAVLSPELSAQAGRDLYRYAREGDRIVLPATIGGVLGAPSVSIDAGDAVQRAIRNKVEEEAGSLLNRLLKKKKQ
jgi:uncharacterized protein involved in outer membrane biogenesis